MMKPLILSFELTWRDESDKQFSASEEWKAIRADILTRDNYTCAYCGFRNLKGQHVNHIDGNPKHNNYDNLEVVCPDCHKYLHSGLWCAVFVKMRLFRVSKYTNNEIVKITRNMRQNGKTDSEIIRYLGLKKEVPWKQDLNYLAPLYGFITSDPILRR